MVCCGFLTEVRGTGLFTCILIVISLLSVSTVDEAIQLYEMGDSPGAIIALEEMINLGSLSFDEELRAWDRLGSSYYAMGNPTAAASAYAELLKLDVYYDLSPRANPRLQSLLNDVRNNTMASAMVRSEPAGAFVTLDGQVMGVTPIMLDGLVGGNDYEVNVYQVGYSPEMYQLSAEPGFSHMLQFSLDIIPDETSVAVAASGQQTSTEIIPDYSGAGSDTSTTSSFRPDELIASPFETNTEPIESSSTTAVAVDQQTGNQTAASPQTTAELLAMLSSGGGIDMAAMNTTDGLTSANGASGESIGLAGSNGGVTGLSHSGVAAQAEALGREIMVFSDLSNMSTTTSSGSDTYSSRSGEEIAELVAEKRGSVMYVYNKHLRTDPLLMGRVEVAMIIHPSGRVSDVEIVSSNMYNVAFELELTRSIEQWRFGSVSENEGPIPIQLPLTFSP